MMGATRVVTGSQPDRSCSVQHSNPPAAFYWVGRRFLAVRYQTAPGCVVPADCVA